MHLKDPPSVLFCRCCGFLPSMLSVKSPILLVNLFQERSAARQWCGAAMRFKLLFKTPTAVSESIYTGDNSMRPFSEAGTCVVESPPNHAPFLGKGSKVTTQLLLEPAATCID
jgi:hypothetical protein